MHGSKRGNAASALWGGRVTLGAGNTRKQCSTHTRVGFRTIAPTWRPSTSQLLPTQPTFRVAGTLASPAPPSTAWAALTDYAAAADIFASVAACRELGPPSSLDAGAPRPSTPLPDDAVLIEQTIGWSFLVFGGAFTMTLAVARVPPPPGAPPGTRALAFDLVQSRYLASFRGVWTVAPDEGGGCSVTHELAVTPRAAPPAAIHGVVQSLFARQVKALLADLEAELVKRAR